MKKLVLSSLAIVMVLSAFASIVSAEDTDHYQVTSYQAKETMKVYVYDPGF
ncbi:hypothetical protein [Brevibacillus dissolubilis]|uniref:hypothetical protein n=1 Tax=Brevibacillus dissolubilis TaxID=1844116 RepID=UPI00159BC827|nr:hypothetical protein [Brevibacillus dissolubilis]